MQSKPWLWSKTIWFNVIMTVMDFMALKDFMNVIPQSWLPWLAAIQGLGNIVLRRWFTTQPLS